MQITLRTTARRMVLAALCTGALCAMPMLAQDAAPAAPQGQMGPHGGGRMEARQVEMLTKRLNLTADQQTQVKAIDDETMKQMAVVRNDTSLSQDDKRSKMMEIRKGSQDKIRAVLTDEQKPKYDAYLAEMRDRMRERGQGGGGTPPAAPPQ